MKIEIKSWWNGSVLFEGDFSCIAEAVSAAVRSRANLTGANLTRATLTRATLTHANLTRATLTHADLTHATLTDADLTDADLTRATLTGANLTGADLTHANLTDADLTHANLTHANLTHANLTDATLTHANLTGADLTHANLTGANLTHANLTHADLTRANLTPIRDDIWAVLCSAPAEAPALLQALKDGKVNGTAYEGQCACLVGTIANARHCNYEEIPGLKPNASRPAERFFMNINKGDTPETSQSCKIAAEWVEDFITRMTAAFGAK